MKNPSFDPHVRTVVRYIPKNAPLGYAAAAAFPYLPQSAQQASSQFREGARRVLVTITIEEFSDEPVQEPQAPVRSDG